MKDVHNVSWILDPLPLISISGLISSTEFTQHPLLCLLSGHPHSPAPCVRPLWMDPKLKSHGTVRASPADPPVALVEEALEEAVAVVARDRLLEGVHVPLAPARRRARQAWRRGRLGP